MSPVGPSDRARGTGGLRAALPSTKRSRLILAVVAGVVLLVGAITIGRVIVSSPATEQSASSVPSVTAQVDPPDFTRFRDTESGFSIAYPKAWSRRSSDDPQVKLLVTRGRATSLLVRVAPVGLDVTAETLPIVRDLTDNLVRADGRVQVLKEPQPLVLDGLPGYRYDYTFNTASGSPGAHVHYFLFRGGQLITLVFQALPAQRFNDALPLFDQIAATFRSAPA